MNISSFDTIKKLDLSKTLSINIRTFLIHAITFNRYDVFLYVLDYYDIKTINNFDAITILNETINNKFVEHPSKVKIKIFNELLIRGININYYVKFLKYSYRKEVNKEFRDTINLINRKIKVINKKIRNNKVIEI